MTSPAQIENVGLPVFPAEELWRPRSSHPPESVDTAVRTIDVGATFARYAAESGLTLPEVLDITDETLGRTARTVGATVVEHEWGIIPYHFPLGYPHHLQFRALIPEGFRLAAQVAILEKVRPLNHLEIYKIATIDHLDSKRRNKAHGQIYSWSDCKLSQFTFGTRRSPGTTEEAPRLWLHDIDPYINPPSIDNRA